MLKIVALISMLIDHFAHYFHFMISPEIYFICRAVGRIAMPIFVFLLVQGFLHTKDIKKYLCRLLITALVTQLGMVILGLINREYFAEYVIKVTETLNILFSFVLSLILLMCLDRQIIKEDKKKLLDKFIRVIIAAIIVAMYTFINIDYEYIVPILCIVIYIFEKLKINIKDKILRYIHILLECTLIFCISAFQSVIYGLFSALAIPLIAIYNGKLGKKSIIIKKSFYIIFIFQHLFFYLSSLITYGLTQ